MRFDRSAWSNALFPQFNLATEISWQVEVGQVGITLVELLALKYLDDDDIRQYIKYENIGRLLMNTQFSAAVQPLITSSVYINA